MSTSIRNRPRAGNRTRFAAFAATAAIIAIAVLVAPASAAAAGTTHQSMPAVTEPATPQCSVAQWQNPADFSGCVSRLANLSSARLQCLSSPTPETPDSGLAGWFAAEPASSRLNGPKGLYSRYGYAGYDYTTYDVGCVSPLTHPTATFDDTVANGEFMIATSVVGASNALREKSWDPGSLWGWADSLVRNATRSIYTQVFTVFGTITLAIVGLYLLWRSRQADMSAAMTTAGWALLVMVAITALAAWPVRSAHVADSALVQGLGAVHSAVSAPEDQTGTAPCALPDPDACVDHRPPAVRASDTATETLLYRNWLRGLLGSADSPTALKYGPVLYDSRALTWDQEQQIAAHPDTRDAIIQAKQQEWMK
ncbi:MAG TPA: MFS transporter, partial [Micromonosporaceae bacterium]